MRADFFEPRIVDSHSNVDNMQMSCTVWRNENWTGLNMTDKSAVNDLLESRAPVTIEEFQRRFRAAVAADMTPEKQARLAALREERKEILERMSEILDKIPQLAELPPKP